MRSLIANKIAIKFIFSFRSIPQVPLFKLDNTITVYFFAILLYTTVRQIFTTAIFKPRLIFSQATSHKADCRLSIVEACRLLCLAFFLKQNVHFLAFSTTLLRLYFCVCSLYTLRPLAAFAYVAFSLSISFILILMLLLVYL